MSFPVIVRPQAEQDLREARIWYEEKRTGLGMEFLAAINTVFQQIGEQPLQYPLVYRQLRRAILRRFPYLIYFCAGSDRVEVVACLHSKRSARLIAARSR